MRRLGLVAVTLLVSIAACTSPDRPTVQADEVPLPTPLRSFDSVVAGTVDQLQAAVATVGSRLEVPASAYRPSEPASLLQVPRAVLRAELADTDDGYVVIYDAGERGAAQDRAADLADYLGSGFGQTNFPADTQFSVSVLGDTVIFTSRSSRRSDDAQRAEEVFDAIAGVGDSVEVNK
jgi:hypothetical protein